MPPLGPLSELTSFIICAKLVSKVPGGKHEFMLKG